MHDEHLSTAIKEAGESFTPPIPDVHGIVRRGRSRTWATKLLAAACIVVVAAGAVALVRSGVTGGDDVVSPAAAPPPSLEWTQIADSPLSTRFGPVSVWTGSEMILWGGNAPTGNDHFVDGASYDPAADAWAKLPRSPLKVGGGRTALWTGSEMILWGGEYGDGSHEAPDTGAAFNPTTGKWRRLPSSLPYWSLAGHTAVWTGTEMIVWGGVTSGPESGGIYNPETGEWRTIPEAILDTRHGHAAVWTGDRMIVWGGKSQGGTPVTGGEGATFDPATGVWTPIAESPLETLIDPVTVWTGEEMIVTGGLSHPTASRAGAAYDPASDRWRKIRDVPVAVERDGAPIPITGMSTPAQWTGETILLVTPDGVLSYNPEDDRWHFVDTPDEAAVRAATTAWTGDALIVWGGRTWDAPTQPREGWIARY